jgi:hypothetical protein
MSSKANRSLRSTWSAGRRGEIERLPGVAQGVPGSVGLGQQLTGRGLIVPEVAGPLECNEVTARDAVHRLAAGGFDALADLLRPGRPASVTREDRAAALDKPLWALPGSDRAPSSHRRPGQRFHARGPGLQTTPRGTDRHRRRTLPPPASPLRAEQHRAGRALGEVRRTAPRTSTPPPKLSAPQSIGP